VKYSTSDKATDEDHQKQPHKENGISHSFDPMHTIQAARPQSPIREQTENQEDERIYRQKIVYNGLDFVGIENNTEETNHRKTDTDQRRGNGEDMNADVGF
jgi:hypothetical protein